MANQLQLPPELAQLLRTLPDEQARMLIQQWMASQQRTQRSRGPSPAMVQQIVSGATGQGATGATGATTAAPSGASGSGGLMAAASNPAVWIPAAIIAGSTVLDQTGVSSYGRQLKGKAVKDVLKSKKVDKLLDKAGLPKELTKLPLEHIDALGRLDLKDAGKSAVKPIQMLFDAFQKLF